MCRDSLEKSTYYNPSRKVFGEFAGYLQFCLLCQGALHGIISSTSGLFSSKGIAQHPTPIETLDSGNAFFNPFSKGVATSTSPKSLLRRTKKFFSILLIFMGYEIRKLKESSSPLLCKKDSNELMGCRFRPTT